ncbi:periplasmic chaperone for outer membrane proteins Skp [Maridesulfovibrio ferrireducens]|uniref:Periplasmic chaperone for outer membrane proteins Skp n=1 Tax=Maridesulfovibrio ferrireducens TaxID=246191 RepID=A0A1G9HCX6_9BACT|nr:OmpH family outer membrane protein [Maridesulfovibrio ferrireducens]SDL10871.1 periplasmic chaperone for outer membrane proteins Skp [Maridesulfovibrio ferrireducens]
MRKILFLVLVLVLAFQAHAFAGTQKIGVAAMGKLIKDSEAGQAAQKQMEKKFVSAKKKLESKQKELEALKQSLQKQSLVLSLEAKQDKELEFKRKVRDYQDLAQATQRKMQAEEQKVGTPVLEIIKAAVDTYAKKNSFIAIFDKGSSGFLYVDETIDVTNEILLEMNRAYRAGKK